jgi:putative tryptophan/tyrosine transport system substrate-binding protein
MNRRRKLVIALGAAALAAPFGSSAQQQLKVARIGLLGAAFSEAFAKQVEALRVRLRELGYAEGKNIAFEYRWADDNYDQLPVLAAELVRLKVDVIVTRGTPAAGAARKATVTIPIVMVNVGDPIGQGFAQSLAHPGGNITGLSNVSVDLGPKHLEMLLSMAPKLSRVAVLANPNNPNNISVLKSIQAAAQRTNATIQPAEARSATEIEKAISGMTRGKVGGFIVMRDALLNQQTRQIAELALKNRLLSIAAIPEFAEAGGLMSYGADNIELFRRAATYVDKILKGAKPGDLPVEQPTKFELLINGKTAKALGLKIPPSLLISADKVIE